MNINMNTDITNFITVVYQKNGITKIKHDRNNETNIYKLLHDLGYRKSKFDNKRIYFRIVGQDFIPANMMKIKRAFLEFLRCCNYSNCPENVNHNQILNWYHEKNPIKENGLLDNYLGCTLTTEEEHKLRLKLNPNYKHNFDINTLLAKFDEWKFAKTVDKINSYSSDNPPLYHKKLAGNKFLVFNHRNCNNKYRDSFDCWIATYNNEKYIGIKKPIELKELRLGFKLERDLSFVEQYLN